MSRESLLQRHAACVRPGRNARRLALSLIAAVAIGSPAFAQPIASSTSTPISGVVELFTSQGCAPCAPADETITRLAQENGLLVLAYHVDYWDYIGWRDTLGSPRNAERQRAYMRALGERSVFTPQIVVNGTRNVPPAGEGVDQALAAAPLNTGAEGASVRLSRDGATLRVVAQAPEPDAESSHNVLIFLTFRERTETRVDKGENGGKNLVNTHAVRDWQVLGQVDGQALELDMPLGPLMGSESEPTHGAAILQRMEEDGTPGPILAAATLPL